MLESIESVKLQALQAAAQLSVADQHSPLATITASDVAAAIGRIGPAYVLNQQAFIDNHRRDDAGRLARPIRGRHVENFDH
jgi:hypothetical protein